MDDKEALLEQIREGLRKHDEYYKSDGGYTDPYLKTHEYGINFSEDDIASITIGNGATTHTGGYTYPNNWTGTGVAAPNVYISPNTWSTGTSINWEHNKPSGKITLQGADADIDINGRSLVKILDDIADRLAILETDADMEKEWDELRAIREQYNAKLQECREKSRAWRALKQT